MHRKPIRVKAEVKKALKLFEIRRQQFVGTITSHHGAIYSINPTPPKFSPIYIFIPLSLSSQAIVSALSHKRLPPQHQMLAPPALWRKSL